MVRFANAPSDPLPAHNATPPLFAAPRSSTERLGFAAPFTKTSTRPCARTMRAWNQPFGSGAGSIACLELPGPLGAEALPRVGRVRHVLDRVGAPLAFGGAEVERPEVHRVQRCPVDDVEGDAEEALLGDVLALQIDFDDALTELDPVEQGAAVARARVEAGDRPAVLLRHRQRPVVDLGALAVAQPREVRRRPARAPERAEEPGRRREPAQPPVRASRDSSCTAVAERP